MDENIDAPPAGLLVWAEHSIEGGSPTTVSSQVVVAAERLQAVSNPTSRESPSNLSDGAGVYLSAKSELER